MDRSMHRITARRDGNAWAIRAPEIFAATRAGSWDDVDPIARSLVATWLRVPIDSFDVEVTELDETAPR
jgi:hypothetical protein